MRESFGKPGLVGPFRGEVEQHLGNSASYVDGIAELFPGAVQAEGREGEYRVRGELGDLNASLAALIARGGQVAGFFAEESRLEREFRAAVGEGS